MNTSRCDLMRWQFELTWSLFEYHLERLTPDDFLWEPAPICWTVRPDDSTSRWLPDWADVEPDPVPVPTIAWVSWHIGWWWGTAIDHAQGRTPPERTAVTWPGDGAAAVEWLRGLRQDWVAVLERFTDADLDAVAAFPPQDDPDYTVAHMVAWVNAELMKNVTEIGHLRMIRAASAPARSARGEPALP